MGKGNSKPNRYVEIVSEVFRKHYRKNASKVAFEREEFAAIAEAKGIKLPKNLGDAIYVDRLRVVRLAKVEDLRATGALVETLVKEAVAMSLT